MRDKSSEREATDTDDDDTCPGCSKGAGAAGQKVEESEMRSKKLSRDGEAQGEGSQGCVRGWCLVLPLKNNFSLLHLTKKNLDYFHGTHYLLK